MSSKLEKRERRRAERLATEQAEVERERRMQRLRIAGGAAVTVLAVGAAIAIVLLAGGEGKRPAEAEAAFGQHYQTLEQRRMQANVSTMSAPSASDHTHPQLSIWTDGKKLEIPANIGIDPQRPPGDMASLHTHDASGTVHNEGQANPTLGQFFAIWGVDFGPDRLGPYRAGNGKVVQMWVDGKPSMLFDRLPFEDEQDIRISYGPRRSGPPGD